MFNHMQMTNNHLHLLLPKNGRKLMTFQ